MRIALEITDRYTNVAAAREALAFQASQDGYIAGRVYSMCGNNERWHMQSFHEPPENVAPGTMVTEGAWVRLCPESLLTECARG